MGMTQQIFHHCGYCFYVHKEIKFYLHLQGLVRKFSNVAADLERLQKCTAELEVSVTARILKSQQIAHCLQKTYM